MADPRYYMACIDLTGRSVLVVGAAASRSRRSKVCSLRAPQVTVVAPQIVPDLAGLDVTLVRRGYRSEDLDGHFLVIAATSTTSVNRRVFRDAEARRQLCNVVDVPEFVLVHPSRRAPPGPDSSRRLDRRSLPALAQRLRDEIAAVVRPEHADLAYRLRELRPWAKSTSPPMTSARNTSQGS